jgi:methylated-DNA-protein-cysteine methyltransferase-like protein
VSAGSDAFERIYEVARRIPEGCVATYGQIARLAGLPRGARTVGWAMHAVPEQSDVPWWRVINAKGRISGRPGSALELIQRALLEGEGVEFAAGGRIDLATFGWEPGPEDLGRWLAE